MVFQDLTLSAQAGETLLVIGKNGAGKTTLLRLMAGLVRPCTGDVLIDGASSAKIRASTLAGTASLAFQITHHEFFSVSVEEEIRTTLRIGGCEEKNQQEEKIASICQFFGLEHVRSRHPFSLSGGEKRRLTLAILQAMDSSFLLLDEPTQGLDREGRSDLLRFLRERKELGKGIVVATHDIAFGIMVADRLVVLDRGTSTGDFRGDQISWSALHEVIDLPPFGSLSLAVKEMFPEMTHARTPKELAEQIRKVLSQ
jgi:energy-coupling factor transporter ATP-binding protein EcfA2